MTSKEVFSFLDKVASAKAERIAKHLRLTEKSEVPFDQYVNRKTGPFIPSLARTIR
jgi:hypothetical protein